MEHNGDAGMMDVIIFLIHHTAHCKIYAATSSIFGAIGSILWQDSKVHNKIFFNGTAVDPSCVEDCHNKGALGVILARGFEVRVWSLH